MAGFSVANNEHLIRSNIWDGQLKDVLEDTLLGMGYVDWITGFNDGDTMNIPSIGQMEVQDYAEGQAIRYTAMDTGNFTFSVNKYKSSATFIYDKFKQDSMYMSRVESSFVPKMHRAIAKAMEVDILAIGPDGQTASDPNVINGADHRFVGNGTNETIAVKDFQLARYALQKANVPLENLIAIVDPSVEYALATMTNLVNVSNNKSWEGIIRDGMATGLKFKMNIFGWDIYISQNLKSGIAQTVNGTNSGGSKTTTVGVGNLFFSATPDVLPFIGSIRQPVKVESERNKDFQREEYVTTCRYGTKLYRPENLVVIVTDTDQVG